MTIEKTLFAAADKMRGSMDPGEYKHVALGLLFLRYIGTAFQRKYDELLPEGGEVAEDVDEYLADGIFWVPEAARWSILAANAKDKGIGVKVDNAMRAIEADNEQLKGALPKVFGRESLDPAIVTGLIDLFSNIEFDGTPRDFDLIGRIYEYFISEFASNEGKRGGDFHTPKPVVELMVQMIEPARGRLYEPCHGSGSFMVQSENFLNAHKYRRADLAIYGQERNHTTYGLARMNLAIRGIVANLQWNAEGTLLRDAIPDEKFDYVMANPPFNISDWSGDILAEDRRWKFGTPPVGNANYAWMQHIYDKLGSTGVAGVVMANGSMSSMSSGEPDAGAYADEPGFCKAASMEEIAKHNYVLNPGRYVGAGAAEEDGEPFEEKFDRLTAELRAQFAEGQRLEQEIEARLGQLSDV